MVVLTNDTEQALLVERWQDGEDDDMIAIFRYSFTRDEITSSFCLTKRELTDLVATFNGHDGANHD